MIKTTNTINQYYKGNSNSAGMTMKKKYANKFNKVSSNTNFSINSDLNQYYIGNMNHTRNKYVDCRDNIMYPTVSVKSQFALMRTRIKGDGMYCNPVISFECYKKLTDPDATNVPDDSYNMIYTKIIKANNQDYSQYIQNLVSNCTIVKDISETTITNCQLQKSINNTNLGRLSNLTRNCQVIKDIKGVKVNRDYSDYLMTLKNKNNCFNPKNANTKICRIY